MIRQLWDQLLLVGDMMTLCSQCLLPKEISKFLALDSVLTLKESA